MLNAYESLLDCVITSGRFWPKCNGKLPIYYVSIYKVVNRYGGPEEGGWTYNNYYFLASRPVDNYMAARRLMTNLRGQEMLSEHKRRFTVMPMHGDPRDPMNDSEDWTPRGDEGDTKYEVILECAPKHTRLTDGKYFEVPEYSCSRKDMRLYPVGSATCEGRPHYE